MKKAISLLLAVIMAVSVFAGLGVSASAAPPANGWYNDGNEWYFYVGGQKHRGWLKEGNNWYYFADYQGEMLANEGASIGGEIYIFNAQGIMQSNGWFNLTATSYEIYGIGHDPMSVWYYLTSSGAATKGWKQIKGTWYYFDKFGVMMCNDLIEIDGQYYAFAPTGAMYANSWYKQTVYDVEVFDVWYYCTSSGACAKGWLKIGGKWYYFDPYTSEMVHSRSLKINGTVYVFSNNGDMLATGGWYKLKPLYYYYQGKPFYGNEEWFYISKNGACATGWKQIGGVWYFFDYYNGAMYSNTVERFENGKIYGFKASGAMCSGEWFYWAGNWFYFWKDGHAQVGWLEYKGNQYYLNEDGTMRTEPLDVGSFIFYFNENGVCLNPFDG